MKYPDFIKKGDTIGICSPSGGITDKYKMMQVEYAIKNLEEKGYKVIITKNAVGNEEKGRSSDAKIRAGEFMELYENPDVKLIIFSTGGEFLCEMLDYLDFEKLKLMKPKWIQGYSDISGIELMFNTILEIPSIYGPTIKHFSMRPFYKTLDDNIDILCGNEIIQNSLDMYEGIWKKVESEEDVTAQYNFTDKVEWKIIKGGSDISFRGRSIGGCLDAITYYFGTKYDNIKNYIGKYENDGIVWFLECFDLNTASLYRNLWQMKNSGFFENCKGLFFGRSLMMREECGINFEESILEALKEYDFPIITDVDIGHKPPQISVVNGGIIEVSANQNKGSIKNYFK